MRKSLAVLMLAVGMTGCSDSPEGLVKKRIAAMNDLSDGFDQGDISKIRAAATHLKALRQKETDRKISADETKKLEEKYKTELDSAHTRMFKSMGDGAFSSKFTSEQKKELLEIIKDLSPTMGGP